MASEREKHEWRPETENIISTGTTTRTENIVEDDGDYEEIERPKLQDFPISSTDSEEQKLLRRTETNQSTRQRRTFEPIKAGDAEELTRIASSWEDEGASVVRTSTRGSELQKTDTLAGIYIGDAVLNPKSPEFDPYKWARM
jgi:ATP-binding cassette subfamily G (WHITE) protein 2 (PDR)